MPNASAKEEMKRFRQTTMSFPKRRRRCSNEEGICNEVQAATTFGKTHHNGLLLDFHNDLRVLEAQKKISNSMQASANDTKLRNESKFAFGATSTGECFESKGNKWPVKPRIAPRQDPKASYPTDFKMASGCSPVKEMRRVTAPEDDENVENAKERRRYLGNRPIGSSTGQPLVPQFGAKPQTSNRLLLHGGASTSTDGNKREGWKAHESLKYFDEALVDLIESEIMSTMEVTGWADVAGLEGAKKTLEEIVILPFLRPDMFTGIRAPPKGVLLFGPPGTGKTMIGRCVASQSKAKFFNIAASSLTSKWVGEGEKLVRVLFVVARLLQPSIIFIDEIDSLLASRSESEHESSRRIKTEFLVQLDGVATLSEERLLVLGATNRPQELDEAAKRRFVKRLYVGLPCAEARVQIVRSLLQNQSNSLSKDEIRHVGELTEGYSGADMKQLCAEASMYPIRDIIESSSLDIATVPLDQVRPIALQDFLEAVKVVRPTVIEKDLDGYRKWDKQFGSLSYMDK